MSICYGKKQTHFTSFLASPSDVVDERKVLEDVVNEVNLTAGEANGIHVELVKWETHTRPGFGEDPQDVVNAQIGENYDIFVGVMWGRFGSPTSRADSGTEEEFNRALERLQNAKDRIEIMFYFKTAGISPNEIDPLQLSKVQEFKRKISDNYGGLYHEFNSTDEFETKVRIHLSRLVSDWASSKAEKVSTERDLSNTKADDINPLANLSAIADEDFGEEDIFELTEKNQKFSKETLEIIESIAQATDILAKRTVISTEEVKQFAATGNILGRENELKNIINKQAANLEKYIKVLTVEIPRFHEKHPKLMDNLGNIALLSSEDSYQHKDDYIGARNQIREYRFALAKALEELTGFQEVISGLPRSTSTFNRARQRSVAVMEDLKMQWTSALNQCSDIEQLLTDLIGDGD